MRLWILRESIMKPDEMLFIRENVVEKCEPFTTEQIMIAEQIIQAFINGRRDR